MDESAPRFARRLAWHARAAWRASRFGILAALVGGAILRLILTVQGSWLAALVAVAAALLALVMMLVAHKRPLPPSDLAVAVAFEKVGAADQVAHGLLRSAFILGSLAVGFLVGGLAVAGGYA